MMEDSGPCIYEGGSHGKLDESWLSLVKQACKQLCQFTFLLDTVHGNIEIAWNLIGNEQRTDDSVGVSTMPIHLRRKKWQCDGYLLEPFMYYLQPINYQIFQLPSL